MDVLVIGGGAAGLMAAGTAAKNGLKVTLLERNDKLARKVAITGKGRCNVTNDCPLLNDLIANIPVNGRFLFGAFSRFDTADTMDFFENLGVPLKIERGNRVFPVSDKALDIVDALNKYITINGVTRKQGRATELIIEDGKVADVYDHYSKLMPEKYSFTGPAGSADFYHHFREDIALMAELIR